MVTVPHTRVEAIVNKKEFPPLRSDWGELFRQCRTTIHLHGAELIHRVRANGTRGRESFRPKRPFHRMLAYIDSIWNSVVLTRFAVRDFYERAKIQLRISSGLGLAVALGMFLLGAISVRQHEANLRRQMSIVGTTIVQNVADVSRDNILLNSLPIIQEAIIKFAERDIPGLEEISVMDRHGVIVAHSVIDSVYRHVAPDVWNAIRGTGVSQQLETEADFIYVEPIVVRRHERTPGETIFLGAARLRFSKEAVFASIGEVTETFVLVGVAVFLVAIPLIFVLAGKFFQVAIVLSNAARLVGMKKPKAGELSSAKDVIGLLTTELDLMVRKIQERTTMEKYVSQATMQMVTGGKALPSKGARKQVAVLFSDVRNFSALSEQMSPEEIVEVLNQYLDVQTRVIHQHHGFVDKFMGDGIMSIFTGDRMACSAVSTAISLQQEISRLNAERTTRKEVPLSVGIGITVGDVVLGSIGSGDRMDYTVIGDTVNLASRLCSVAGADEILVSEGVVGHLNDAARSLVNPVVKMSIRGRRDPVSVYQIQYSTSEYSHPFEEK